MIYAASIDTTFFKKAIVLGAVKKDKNLALFNASTIARETSAEYLTSMIASNSKNEILKLLAPSHVTDEEQKTQYNLRSFMPFAAVLSAQDITSCIEELPTEKKNAISIALSKSCNQR